VSLHTHIVHCRLCSIDDLRLCAAVSAETQQTMRMRAAENPEAHRAYADKVIYERITTTEKPK